MMPPKRKTARDLPPNLYPNERNGVLYYRYRHPERGTWHGMGSDKAKAIKDAKALNAHIYASASLTVNILAAHPETPKLSAVILRHIELCEIKHQRGKLADNTLKTKRSIGEAIRKQFVGLVLAVIFGLWWLDHVRFVF